MRKKLVATVIIVAVAAGGGWYWTTTRAGVAAAQNQPQFIFATVQRGDIRSTISGTGPVASVNGVMVKTNQSGTISQVLAKDGDRVKAGQVIMVLENPTLESQVRQAQVDLANNQASLENLLNPQATAVRAQMLKIESAKLTLKQRQQDVERLTISAPRSGIVTAVKTATGSDIAANTALFTIFDDANASFTVAVSQTVAGKLNTGHPVQITFPGFGQVEGRVAQGAASATPTSGNRDANVPISVALPPMSGLRPGMVGQAVIQMEGLDFPIQANGSVDADLVEVRSQVAGSVGALTITEGDRVAAGDRLLTLTSDTLQIQLQQAENDLQTQEQSLKNLLDPANDPSGQLTQIMNKIEQSQITLTTRQADLADLQVKAPVDGQISALTLRVGDKVSANTNAFRVADYGQMQTTISVDELDVALTKVGQRAEITLDAIAGKTYAGKVTKINPEGVFRNDIATFEVTVQIDQPTGLMAGMNSTVNIVTQEKLGVLWLPAQTVTVRQGRAFVQVLEGGEVKQKQVEVGVRTSTQVEIAGGLNEKDQVIQTIIRPTAQTGFSLFGGNRQQQQTQTTVPVDATQRQQMRQQGTFPRTGTGTGTGTQAPATPAGR